MATDGVRPSAGTIVADALFTPTTQEPGAGCEGRTRHERVAGAPSPLVAAAVSAINSVAASIRVEPAPSRENRDNPDLRESGPAAGWSRAASALTGAAGWAATPGTGVRRGTDGTVLSLGSAALLRLSALPIRLWTASGNPTLFDQLRSVEEATQRYATEGRRVADRIAAEMVPHPGLDSEQQVTVLRMRRRLHRADLVTLTECDELAEVAVGLGRITVAGELHRVGVRVRGLTDRLTALDEAVVAERTRVDALPWRLAWSSPYAMAALGADAPGMLAAFDQLLSDAQSGRSAGGPALGSDHLWRLLTHATLAPQHPADFPYGWLGHVALLPVGGPGTPAGGGLLTPGTTAEQYAAHQLHSGSGNRPRLDRIAEPERAWVSITGLHWEDEQYLHCWVVDGLGERRMRRLRLQRTRALDAVLSVLLAGPRALGSLLDLLLPATAGGPERSALRDFVAHLVDLGVVQFSTAPASQITGWLVPGMPGLSPATAARTVTGSVAAAGSTGSAGSRPRSGGQLNVYRRVPAAVPRPALVRIGALTRQAGRIAALVAAEHGRAPAHPVTELVGAEPRPVPEVVAEYLERTGGRAEYQRPAVTGERSRWPVPSRAGTPYSRLVAWVRASVPGVETLDLSPELLDDLGVPQAAPLSWPVDCVVRPFAPRAAALAALSSVSPAGVGDARFVDALTRLHGEPAHVAAYRQFLRELERRCDVRCVELLVPPTPQRSSGAGNPAARPRYTDLCTGDADLNAYLPDGVRPPTYLPLHRILVRRVGGELVAEGDDGQRLWPVCHSGSQPMEPWGAVQALLLAASPAERLTGWFGAADPLAAFPGLDRIPRLTMGGDLVLSGAQWRLGRAEFWDPAAPLTARARRLAGLRSRFGLPRWVWLRPDAGSAPLRLVAGASDPVRPVDLDSLPALRTVERMLADPTVGALLVEEMAPDPDWLPVADTAHAPGDRLAAELVLRLPATETPAELAVRAFTAWRAGSVAEIVDF